MKLPHMLIRNYVLHESTLEIVLQKMDELERHVWWMSRDPCSYISSKTSSWSSQTWSWNKNPEKEQFENTSDWLSSDLSSKRQGFGFLWKNLNATTTSSVFDWSWASTGRRSIWLSQESRKTTSCSLFPRKSGWSSP